MKQKCVTSNACIQSWLHGSFIIQSNIHSVFNDPGKGRSYAIENNETA